MQKWKKLGRIFVPDGSSEWMHSHAMMPIVEQLEDDLYSVYFSPRDRNNRSRPARLNLRLFNDLSWQISNLSSEPLLELGALGCFDDAGVMPSSLVESEAGKLMYFNGWTLAKSVPFYSFNGIALSKNAGTGFRKLSTAPRALYRNETDPISTFAPFVLKEKEHYKMWYVSCTCWQNGPKPKHYYNIRYADSEDGLHWRRTGHVCIDFKSDREYALARPMVLKEKGIYKMWYSYRASDGSERYLIGFATSSDGLDWIRKDEEIQLLTSSGQSWDSEMICYAYIFDFRENRMMLYNGNGYGRTGFGLAILEQE